MDPLQPVIPGSPVGKPTDQGGARRQNAILRAAQSHQRSRFGQLGGKDQASEPINAAIECFILNKTTTDLPQGSVLAQQGRALIDPARLPLDAQQGPAFEGKAITDAAKPFVITAEPISVGSVGDAVVAGLAVVSVNVTDATHTRAIPVVGVTNRLVSAADGGVPLWWTPGGTGLLVCVVLMGDQKPVVLPINYVGTSSGSTASGAYGSVSVPGVGLVTNVYNPWGSTILAGKTCAIGWAENLKLFVFIAVDC